MIQLHAQWDSHLKFAGRAPRTLAEVAAARADYEHRSRLDEIKRMATPLRLLDEFVGPLAARGIKLWERRISTSSDKTVWIHEPMFGGDEELHAALLALGFQEVDRSPCGSRDTFVRLKHGRWLVVRITIRTPVPTAQSQAPASEPQPA